MTTYRRLIALVASLLIPMAGFAGSPTANPQESAPPSASAEATVQHSGVITGKILLNENWSLIPSLNVGPKHHAKAGTPVYLFLETPAFRKWIKTVGKANAAPPPPEVLDLAWVTRVGYESEFSFVGLPPGQYYVTANMDYVGTDSYSYQSGQQDHYRGGNYVGSSPIYATEIYNAAKNRTLKGRVKIARPSDTASITLRR
jgi:hypothetical protein